VGLQNPPKCLCIRLGIGRSGLGPLFICGRRSRGLVDASWLHSKRSERALEPSSLIGQRRRVESTVISALRPFQPHSDELATGLQPRKVRVPVRLEDLGENIPALLGPGWIESDLRRTNRRTLAGVRAQLAAASLAALLPSVSSASSSAFSSLSMSLVSELRWARMPLKSVPLDGADVRVRSWR
jgi:hypothetical protein